MTSMKNIWNSVALRLSLICGGMVVISVILVSVVFYVGTTRMLAHGIDDKIATLMERLVQFSKTATASEIGKKIDQELNDGIDSDTEIYLLMDVSGHKLAGNIPTWNADLPPVGRIIDRRVMRNGRETLARIVLHTLPDGSLLVVGRDVTDLGEIGRLVYNAIGIGALLALLLSIAGTLLFRFQIERKVGAIRRTALDIETGNLKRRIPVSGARDEFARLGNDLNRMLNRIEHLMDGVRHVSNMIAHNLRTPLGRLRAHLDEATRGKDQDDTLVVAANKAIEDIDGLIVLFNSLLQIAEAESGAKRQTFVPVAVRDIVVDMLELYEAATEEMGVTLSADLEGAPTILGDRELLASALANLLDNALKYVGSPALIRVGASQRDHTVTLTVCDNGPGIPPQERANVLQHFYRLGNGSQPGYGIGLTIVNAIVELHGGKLQLEDAAPGLLIRMTFPSVEHQTVMSPAD